jgi:hypothetical protein
LDSTKKKISRLFAVFSIVNAVSLRNLKDLKDPDSRRSVWLPRPACLGVYPPNPPKSGKHPPSVASLGRGAWDLSVPARLRLAEGKDPLCLASLDQRRVPPGERCCRLVSLPLDVHRGWFLKTEFGIFRVQGGALSSPSQPA